MKKALKLTKYAFLLFLVQVFLLILPIIIDNISYITYISFIINAFISWYIIKQIEKIYYKKYNKWSSMLYNICPLLDVTVSLSILYYIYKSDNILFLMKYYIPLFIVIYIINLIYVLINIKHK
jgi:hypothetical protein